MCVWYRHDSAPSLKTRLPREGERVNLSVSTRIDCNPKAKTPVYQTRPRSSLAGAARSKSPLPKRHAKARRPFFFSLWFPIKTFDISQRPMRLFLALLLLPPTHARTALLLGVLLLVTYVNGVSLQKVRSRAGAAGLRDPRPLYPRQRRRPSSAQGATAAETKYIVPGMKCFARVKVGDRLLRVLVGGQSVDRPLRERPRMFHSWIVVLDTAIAVSIVCSCVVFEESAFSGCLRILHRCVETTL